MDVDWDDLKTVLALVRHETLAAAGADLGVTYTTVARRVQRAQEAVGTVLFERLAGGYQPTEAARVMADYAARMEAEQHGLLRQLQGADQTLAGPLVVTAPQLLIGPYLAPVLERFRAAHPEVELRVRATNDLLDLNRREADLALRISRSPGDTLKGLRVCAQQSASFARADVAERIAAEPGAPIDWIIYEQAGQVPKAAQEQWPKSRVAYVFDDMVAMIGAAQAGLGVVRVPMFLGRATHGLVQVPVLPPQDYAGIWVIAHEDVWGSAKVTALREMLVPELRRRQAEFLA